MQSIIITGATGFIGSALAAEFLSLDYLVIALARNDNHGERTKKAIKKAAKGMDLKINFENFHVKSLDKEGLINAIDLITDTSLASFWHCAAEMSYEWSAAKKSLSFNVIDTLMFMETSKQHGINAFYYYSTVFIAHPSQHIKENIYSLEESGVTTVYQASKIMSETLLRYRAASINQTLVILRSGLAIGHSKTGWSTCKPYGLYMYLNAVRLLKRKNITETCLNIDQSKCLYLVNIDQIVEWSLAVHNNIDTNKVGNGIINLVNEDISQADIQSIADIVSQNYNINISFKEPASRWDAFFSEYISENQQFTEMQWNISSKALNEYGFTKRKITKKMITPSIEYFLDQKH